MAAALDAPATSRQLRRELLYQQPEARLERHRAGDVAAHPGVRWEHTRPRDRARRGGREAAPCASEPSQQYHIDDTTVSPQSTRRNPFRRGGSSCLLPADVPRPPPPAPRLPQRLARRPAPGWAFLRRAGRGFMPGGELPAAPGAAGEPAALGIGSVLTQLGEQVAARGEAARVRDHYLDVFAQVGARRLPAEISVKLTHLGLDIDRAACLADVQVLARAAAEAGSFLWIDMEESRYVDATLEMFRSVRSAHERVGVCLQAYLRRTPADLGVLLPLAPAIRLVKGAYNGPATIACPSKR